MHRDAAKFDRERNRGKVGGWIRVSGNHRVIRYHNAVRVILLIIEFSYSEADDKERYSIHVRPIFS